MKQAVIMIIIVLNFVTTAGAGELNFIQKLGEQFFFDKNLSINRNQSCR